MWAKLFSDGEYLFSVDILLYFEICLFKRSDTPPAHFSSMFKLAGHINDFRLHYLNHCSF